MGLFLGRRHRWGDARLACLLLAAGSTAAGAQLQFDAAGGASGMLAYQMAGGFGAGVAAADFDDDGDIDVFVPTAGGFPDQLYRNLGDGTFEEIAADAGVASLSNHRVALWFDADGDATASENRLDLLVLGDCYQIGDSCPLASTVALYLQHPGGIFVDATAGSGLDGSDQIDRGEHRGGLAAGDLDNDGDLDLYTSFWQGQARLYRNEGGGIFTDISAASGVGQVWDHHHAMMHDFDGDGWIDIYAAIDNAENHLWINQRDGTFVDVAPSAGADNAWNDMGLTLGDADNDGDLDIYITNIEQPDRHNLLLRNDSTPGSLYFTRMQSAGVESGGWGWGTTFLDADNDGDLDLAATNGWALGDYATDQSRFFRNSDPGQLSFFDDSVAVGFDDRFYGSSLVAADFDRDGDLDLLQTCQSVDSVESQIRLLDNSLTGTAHWLVIQPRMTGPNPRAIGARVRIDAQGEPRMRLVTAGTSYLGQEPAEAFFGTGDAAVIDRVEVEWPSGRGRTVVGGVAADQILVVGADAILVDGFESGNLAAWAP